MVDFFYRMVSLSVWAVVFILVNDIYVGVFTMHNKKPKSTGFSLHSESMFRYNIKKDIIIGALLICVLIGIFFTRGEIGNIPAYLNRNDGNAFDRRLMFPHNILLDNLNLYF